MFDLLWIVDPSDTSLCMPVRIFRISKSSIKVKKVKVKVTETNDVKRVQLNTLAGVCLRLKENLVFVVNLSNKVIFYRLVCISVCVSVCEQN